MTDEFKHDDVHGEIFDQTGYWGKKGAGCIIVAYEEAGKRISENQLQILYVFKDSNAGFKYTTYVAIVDDEFHPLLNWESREARWFDYGDWPYPLHYGLAEILRDTDATNLLHSICEEFRNAA